MITYRWVNGWEATQEDWDRIGQVIREHAWMSLNKSTTRVLLAEVEDKLVGFVVVQMVPSLGPMFIVPGMRGQGIAEALTDQTQEFLTKVHARGWLVICDSVYSERLCERIEMEKVEAPVYMTK